ncbi:MAG TPA: hypothetical protein VGD90_12630 [Sphingobacteriaceae bacterium]
MLSFISWQQYLLALAIGGFLYYVLIILAYYRKDLSSFFSEKRPSEINQSRSILGMAKPDANASISSSEIEFSSDNEEQ